MQTILSRLVSKILTALVMVGAVTLLSNNAFAQELEVCLVGAGGLLPAALPDPQNYGGCAST